MTSQNKNDRTKAIVAVIAVVFFMLAVFYFGMKWLGKDPMHLLYPDQKPEITANDGPKPNPLTKKSPLPTKPDANEMAKRKADLGLNKGVDMIVRPGETMKIGDELVSVDEVLDKIRLKTGQIDEHNLGKQGADSTARRAIKLPAAITKLKTLVDEYYDIEKQLTEELIKTSPDKADQLSKRKSDITGMVQIYRQYQNLQNEIKETRQAMDNAANGDTAALSLKIETLMKDKKALEDLIIARVGTEQDLDAYGIYVVKHNDNIWNIHFQFLKEYFAHKGIILSPMADEPAGGDGESSGVGRLLKFSENMVHIYNIRKKALESDLHLIQPLSKIVVFNLTRVFAMLESIDYSDVDRIRFDGETLWLPAQEQ